VQLCALSTASNAQHVVVQGLSTDTAAYNSASTAKASAATSTSWATPTGALIAGDGVTATATVLTNGASQEALHRLERITEQAQPPLHRLEHALHGVVAFGIMPLFALANAGVRLGGGAASTFASPVAIGVVLGLVLGKPVGITLAAWLAVRIRAAEKPEGVSWGALHAVSWLGGIGFTMSLFVAGLAFPGSTELLDSAKLGILAASVLAGLAGWTLIRRVGASASDAVGSVSATGVAPVESAE